VYEANRRSTRKTSFFFPGPGRGHQRSRTALWRLDSGLRRAIERRPGSATCMAPGVVGHTEFRLYITKVKALAFS
jgi:hypothetical protein